jgi:hypothetical protein
MEERRKKRRQRSIKGGKIVFNRQLSVVDCTVRNLSNEGACLVMASPVGLPNTFELLIPDNFKRNCRAIWKSSDKIGVAFLYWGLERLADHRHCHPRCFSQ